MAEFPNAVERGEFLTSLKGNLQIFRVKNLRGNIVTRRAGAGLTER